MRKAVRKDCGKVSFKPALTECLAHQHRDYPHWTYQLHYDNLKAHRNAPHLVLPRLSLRNIHHPQHAGRNRQRNRVRRQR